MNLRTALCCTVVSMFGCSSSGDTGGAGGGSAAGGSGQTGGGSGGGDSASGGGSVATGGGNSGSGGGTVQDAGTPDAGAMDTWTNWASPSFFDAYCTSCHTPGGQGDPAGAHFDFTTYTDVAANAAAIRCGTSVAHDAAWGCTAGSPAPKQFPIGNGPKPTNAERDRLVAWIDGGYPQ